MKNKTGQFHNNKAMKPEICKYFWPESLCHQNYSLYLYEKTLLNKSIEKNQNIPVSFASLEPETQV